MQSSADLVWTINPTTVFNVRGSYSNIIDSFNDDEAKIGREGLESFWPGNPWYQSYLEELPAIYYPGLDIRAASRSRFGRDGFWFQRHGLNVYCSPEQGHRVEVKDTVAGWDEHRRFGPNRHLHGHAC